LLEAINIHSTPPREELDCNLVEPLKDFTEVLNEAKGAGGALSVLLGNGFSIAYDPGAFSYKKLLEAAEFDGIEKDRLFDAVGTADFERAVDALRRSARLVEMYGSAHEPLAQEMRRDAETVKNGLAAVIARIHPGSSRELSEGEVRCAGNFLANFDNIFTLNYDLLLYWVLLRSRELGIMLPAGYDGFNRATPEVDTIVWKSERQHLHYLHGALHLFMEEGPDGLLRLLKLTSRYGNLMDQIQSKIAADSYPLVVTEGSMREKLDMVSSSPYLRSCFEALLKISGTLFLHGVGLNDNDIHIRASIAFSGASRLCVGLHSPTGAAALKARVGDILDRRDKDRPGTLEVVYYDANTANPWRIPA
jgi:hypothetical protein